MKNILLILSLALCLITVKQGHAQNTKLPNGNITEKLSYIKDSKNFSSESKRLKLLFEVYTESQLEASPVTATFFGKPGYNHLWDDVSPEGTKKDLAVLKIFNDSKDWFNLENLTEEDKVNFSIFNRSVGDQYALNSQFPEQYLIIDQIQGIHSYIPAIIQMMPTNSPKALEDIIARLEGISELLKNVEITLSEGIEKGIVMPRTTVVQVPEQLKSMIAETPEESIFYTPFINLEGHDAFKEKAKTIITKSVNPAFDKFKVFMTDTYLPNTRESYGLGELPNGTAWYNAQIKFHTTTNKTAQEIHDIGLSEVARILVEMEKVKSDTGFKGDLNAFNTFLKEDPQFYFDTPEELLSAYRDICKKIDPVLPQLFGKLPRLPYGVKKVPAYSEQATTTAYYNPGSLQSGVAGYFYANTYKLESRPKWEMEALTIHEAVPGHHLQISLAQELENVPEFRTMLGFTAFIEGWGLYSESLGPELGMYQDLYSKYGQLTYEMWRAMRLVVDTGIHAFGWIRQEAIDYFKENSGKNENDISVEVDRYIAWPGQALAYKIGELKIKELRKKSEDILKDQFDIRAFHDVVLGSGTIPLNVLEDNINQWINNQKNN
ncbi:DUF885 domain-containing protein [Winogradskyella psychrotolerans]|uniref:DUF885 domain-containing protein n=1 Tax=Winogradskyella psychrotolerans TaxID=1344585 RepID=UPI001C0798C9|nr:DUF885 domain-containing protein [Winogradskyella psychrotolerans]MBU2927526.1 DUF885 domain-containing protein [Winogradskyella psychrotolerans]